MAFALGGARFLRPLTPTLVLARSGVVSARGGLSKGSLARVCSASQVSPVVDHHPPGWCLLPAFRDTLVEVLENRPRAYAKNFGWATVSLVL